ncbi:MAG: hypothetical protein KOO60_08100 [Gemmatimonadales bacterium]|nr:hypothetical protein [Gemmatimonadales bacterium]
MIHITVIANPFAGAARGRLSGAQAVALLTKRGFQVELCLTKGVGHASSLAAEVAATAGDQGMVVVVGGDGTIHEVAQVLAGTSCPLGVLPSGSGNDFAVGIGCPTVQAGLDAITDGREQEIDVCALDGRPFVNSMGLLASGAISGTASGFWRWLGSGRYVVASLLTILTYRGQDVDWVISGSSLDVSQERLSGEFLLAEFCNGPLTGGGFRLGDNVDLADGLLDLCLVRPIGLVAGLGILPGAAAGRMIEHPAFSRFKSRRVGFKTEKPVPYHLDGEPGILEAGSHRVEVLEKKLKVMVPA